MHYPEHLLQLIAVFKKLPGIGTKSAERFAFHLLDWPKEKLAEMAHIIEETKNKLNNCSECGCLVDKKECPFCQDKNRNQEIFCVVASAKDVFLIEQTHAFRGLYHVLGGLLSPIHGQTPPAAAIEQLKNRVQTLGAKELILALDSTLEGDATALYIKKELSSLNVISSRLALGLPMGSSLDFIDEGTLGRALTGRHTY